ncbi:hypothetical protein M7I_5983 [Glarea lozoyensis 74030]|uniref:Uncharacterized protein n=1 Tax=Glarea lozoyensis (strain ATCC 74030 / MF5533) TaxID=1104152 RepID=H0ETC1_GLAL7|nr:hypothetical protein M7I_5983 [Glarea lozoyensis 74030]
MLGIALRGLVSCNVTSSLVQDLWDGNLLHLPLIIRLLAAYNPLSHNPLLITPTIRIHPRHTRNLIAHNIMLSIPLRKFRIRDLVQFCNFLCEGAK